VLKKISNSRFEIVFDERMQDEEGHNIESTEIIRDKITGVNYLRVYSGSWTMSVLVDRDGKPIVTK
jgi:hypothetical protein